MFGSLLFCLTFASPFSAEWIVVTPRKVTLKRNTWGDIDGEADVIVVILAKGSRGLSYKLVYPSNSSIAASLGETIELGGGGLSMEFESSKENVEMVLWVIDKDQFTGNEFNIGVDAFIGFASDRLGKKVISFASVAKRTTLWQWIASEAISIGIKGVANLINKNDLVAESILSFSSRDKPFNSKVYKVSSSNSAVEFEYEVRTARKLETIKARRPSTPDVDDINLFNLNSEPFQKPVNYIYEIIASAQGSSKIMDPRKKLISLRNTGLKGPHHELVMRDGKERTVSERFQGKLPNPPNVSGVLFKPEDVSIWINKLSLEAFVFHRREVNYSEISHVEYHYRDHWLVVTKYNGKRLDFGVHIQWMARPYFRRAKEIVFFRTEKRKTVVSAKFPLRFFGRPPAQSFKEEGEWKYGVLHPLREHVFSSSVPGFWLPERGYRWHKPEDLMVVPIK